MRFREILLVAVLILAGFAFFQFKTGKWSADWDWDWFDGFDRYSRESSAEETRTIEAPLPPSIEVRNGHGWVEVRGADQETVQLTFKKVAWRRTEEEAREIVDLPLGYFLLADLYNRLGDSARSLEYARKGQAAAEAAKTRGKR